jgi:hydrogenase nickel incorporation protein HypA/HybF
VHELGLTLEIVEIATERSGGAPVRRVRVSIGKLAAVVPDAIRFCFEVCSKETPLEGAELILEESPATARCRPCGAEVRLSKPYGRCGCGSQDLEIMTGYDVVVVDIEVGSCT